MILLQGKHALSLIYSIFIITPGFKKALPGLRGYLRDD